MTVIADPAFAARWPDEAGAEVTVRLRDGSRRSAQCANPRGHHADPVSAEIIEEKFSRLTGRLFPGRRTIEAREAIMAMAGVPDVRAGADRLRALGQA